MDPGVQIGINQVDEEIAGHHQGGEQKVGSGDDRVVSFLEGQQEDTPQAGQGKEVLEDHGAPDQDRQLQANQSHHRDEGIFSGVSEDNDLLLEPLGPGVRI